jgi:hypothetical protein
MVGSAERLRVSGEIMLTKNYYIIKEESIGGAYYV